MGFSENLRNELDYQDMQLKELSQKTGISKNTLDKYLSGPKVQPGVENALKIAEVLNVSVEYLVTGKNSSNKIDLSAEYRQLIEKYESLNQFNRKTVFDLLDSLYKRSI